MLPNTQETLHYIHYEFILPRREHYWKRNVQFHVKTKTGNVRINGTLRRVRVTTVAVEKQCHYHLCPV
jgi:hypothetical protein